MTNIFNLFKYFQKKPIALAIIFHLILSVIIFLPFFTQGKIYLGSDDNRNHHYANLLFNYDTFNKGELGLWNPYFHCGANFSASTHNFIYYPLNWIIFLFPKQYLFFLLTIRIFLETWLIGIFSFLLFKEELKNPKWALFASTIYHLGGNTITGMTIYAYLVITLYVTIGAYIIYSMQKRSGWLSFGFLSLSLYGLHTCFNIVYSLAGSLILCLLFAYKYFSEYKKSPRPHFYSFVFLCAMFCGTLLSMIKLYPVFCRILFEGTRIADISLAPMIRGVYLALSAFVPETFDVYIGYSVSYLRNMTQTPINAQVEAYSYFGVIPIFLILWLCFQSSSRVKFWIGYLAVATLWFLNIPPLNDIIHIISFPLQHPIITKMLIPIPFCVLAGYAGKYIEEGKLEIDKNIINVTILTMSLLAIGMLGYYALTRPLALKNVRMLIILVTIITLIVFLLKKSRLPFLRTWPFLTALLGIIVSVLGIINAGPFIKNVGIKYASFSILLLSISWVWFIFKTKTFPGKNPLISFVGGFFLVALSLYSLQRCIPQSTLKELGSFDSTYLMGFGFIRFVFYGCFLLFFFQNIKNGRIKSSLIFIIVLLLLCIDLIGHQKTYRHLIVQKPFFDKSLIYPSQDKLLKLIDTKNYRTNKPLVFLGLSWNSLASNMHTTYGIRSFGGVDSDVPPYLYHFIENFEDNLTQYNGANSGADNQRFLDLIGSRYSVNTDLKRETRPNTLSRFMLFTNYEVIPDDTLTLKRLKSAVFDPMNTVLLNAPVKFNPNTTTKFSQSVQYESLKTSHLKLILKTNAPALLFFGDSYNEGWKAQINGQACPIIRANYNFMAIDLPQGENTIEFVFRPKTFVTGMHLSIAGAILFFLLLLLLKLIEKRIN